MFWGDKWIRRMGGRWIGKGMVLDWSGGLGDWDG